MLQRYKRYYYTTTLLFYNEKQKISIGLVTKTIWNKSEIIDINKIAYAEFIRPKNSLDAILKLYAISEENSQKIYVEDIINFSDDEEVNKSKYFLFVSRGELNKIKKEFMFFADKMCKKNNNDIDDIELVVDSLVAPDLNADIYKKYIRNSSFYKVVEKLDKPLSLIKYFEVDSKLNFYKRYIQQNTNSKRSKVTTLKSAVKILSEYKNISEKDAKNILKKAYDIELEKIK